MTVALRPSLAVLLAALAVDALIGEPPAKLHPVVWMGTCITRFERIAPRSGPLRQLLAGGWIAWGLPLGSAMLAAFTMTLLVPWPWAAFAVGTYLTKSALALRALGEAGRNVEVSLAGGDLETARYGLRSLCSRDPATLTASQVAAGAIESLAENLSDSFVAPIFWYTLFGVPGAVAYRAINTLDARLGYHGRHEYLGKVAARTDDVANVVPARITACLLLLTGVLAGYDGHRAWRVFRRDARSTESPNAGRPMAAMAGVLGVELAKADQYRLGAGGRPPDARSLADARSLVLRAATLATALAVLALMIRSRA